MTERHIAHAATIALVGLLGLWPHLWFSNSVGEFAFFKAAYDEDTYALFTSSTPVFRLDRLLSTELFRLIRLLSDSSFDVPLVLFDLVAPALAAAAALYLGAAIFRGTAARVLFALLLLFAADLTTLGSSISPVSRWLTIGTLRSLFGESGITFVPNIETTYLTLFRTPEPQTSYAVAFLLVGLLIRYLSGPRSLWLTAALVFAHALAVLCYAFVTFPIFALGLYAGCIWMIAGDIRRGWLPAALALASLGASLIASGGVAGGGINVFVASRLPIVTVSVILSLLLSCVVVAVLMARGFRDRVLWLTLGLAAMPLALMNQQIITGIMVSTKDWERYINPYLLVIAGALLVTRLVTSDMPRMRIVAALGCVVVVGFATLASVQTYRSWLSLNLQSVAIARAIVAANESDSVVVLNEPSLAPLVNIRLGGTAHFLIDYTTLFLDPVPSLAVAPFEVGPTATALFEYFRLFGVTPERFEGALLSEIAQRNGFYSGFLFNVCDYWHPCSDNRGVKSAELAALVPGIVAAFRDYLAAPSEAGIGKLYVTTTPDLGDAGQFFGPTPIATASAGDVTAQAFAQR